MSKFGNWIPDENRFSLPEPPEWVLQKFHNFDHMLVLIPSRKEKQYLLCRRRQFSAGLGDVAMLDNKHPDTNMMIAHGIVPIAPLKFKQGVSTFTAAGVDNVLDELRRRDMWAVGGGPDKDPLGERVWKAVEEHEEAEKQKQRRNLKDMFYHMGRDAYRSLKARTGQRNRRASDYHGVARLPQKKHTPGSQLRVIPTR